MTRPPDPPLVMVVLALLTSVEHGEPIPGVQPGQALAIVFAVSG